MKRPNAAVSISLGGLLALVLATACDKGEEAKPDAAKEEKKVEKKATA